MKILNRSLCLLLLAVLSVYLAPYQLVPYQLSPCQLLLCQLSPCKPVPRNLFPCQLFPVWLSPCQAADFSKAKKIFVPPSYIQRDSNLPLPDGTEMGQPSLAPPYATPSSAAQPSITQPSVTQPTIATTETLSQIQNKVAALSKSGQYDEAESVARAGLKTYPNSSILKKQFANATVAQAKTFLANKEYDVAGKKAREALVADPHNKAAKNIIAQVLQAQGLNPNSADSHVIVANNLAAEGRLLEASVEYKLALNIKPNAGAHVGLGNIAIGKGQIADAQRHFEQALAIDPKFALAYRQRGALRYALHDIAGANSDFGKAVSLAPNDTQAADALISLWKQQVANNPKDANGHLGLARAYLQTNNLEAARAEYKNVVAIDPNNPALPAARASFKIALAKQQAGQCVEAAKTLEAQGALPEAHQKLIEAVSYSPNDSQIYLYDGSICQKMGLNDQAREAYMCALRVDPKQTEAAAKLKALSSAPVPSPMYAQPNMLQNAPPSTLQNAPPNMLQNTPTLQLQTNTFPPSAAPVMNNSPPSTIAPVSAPLMNNGPAAGFPPVAPPVMNAPMKNAPILNNNASPPAEENLPNAPLKSPLTPATQNKSQSVNPQGYYGTAQDFYIGDSPQVTTLANFASCLRALMLAQKYYLQQSNPKTYPNINQSTDISSSQF